MLNVSGRTMLGGVTVHTILSVTYVLYINMTSYTIAHYVISMLACRTGAGVEKMKFSANPAIFSCDLIKKMNTHTLCFCQLIRKLKAFENLKWAQGS